MSLRCALGTGGAVPADAKREGDGASPIGCWTARRVYFRPDRGAAPDTGLPVIALRPEDGWCDDPAETDYNRLVPLPCRGSHERLWREDGLYDLIVELGYNDDPPVAGRGSAIFLHIARPGHAPTQGCAVLAEEDLRAVLKRLGGGAVIEIRA
ncbi:MAG: L,D-transpeptidase family protein [Hyphomonas sp.]|nr:L,D-transpeptidase family protein [Hyphomonas sp.]MBU3919398.1 L,D-transpeptidase family protein [Alphaproteobacteria bacterium]MBU4061980.1 L,D-transpeptidase family protein [Alphaproteobacteria bacterium]MBU4166135.1 L,D-transpeptidase family protein [Alphaproteobacteria bacterium]MBU4569000.1 L,D-transpeptidase family protein [Alphaproteobacteria bacterium]